MEEVAISFIIICIESSVIIYLHVPTVFICLCFQSVNIMTEYKKEFPFPILFPPEVPKNVLAEWLSVHGIPQYHVAGTGEIID